jgi:aminomethyltransferase
MTSDSLSRTPLYALHQSLGAKLVPFAGYEMPVQYPTGIIAEHLHTRAKVSLFDVSHMGQVRLSGPRIVADLEALVPADIAGLGQGRVRYTVFTNESGGILDDLMVCKDGAALRLVINAGPKHTDLAHLRRSLGEQAVQFLDDRALLALQGPVSADVLGRFAPGIGDLGFMTAVDIEIGGERCTITRSGYTGEDGFEISVAASGAEALARRLLAAPDVLPAGLGARDTLRLEAGLCLYGADIDETTSVIEADLAWTIQPRRRREGGFPGASVILRQLADGAPRRLRAVGRRRHRHGLCRNRRRDAGQRDRSCRAWRNETRAHRVAPFYSPPLSSTEGMRASMSTMRYTKEHEWIRIDGNEAVIGITDFAQEQLGDIVYVELPAIGRRIQKGEEAGVVESVKAASEVYAPVSGEVSAINTALANDPARVNKDAVGEGWFFKLKLADPKELDGLMDDAAYQKFTAEPH